MGRFSGCPFLSQPARHNIQREHQFWERCFNGTRKYSSNSTSPYLTPFDQIISTTTMTASISVSPLPIRVNTGTQRRGRRLSDNARTLVVAAVRDIQERKRAGLHVSVREVAERFNVPKSTLHRYLRNSSPRSTVASSRPSKLDISFLVSWGIYCIAFANQWLSGCFVEYLIVARIFLLLPFIL